MKAPFCRIFLLFCIFFQSLTSYAQSISGKVMDSEGEPLTGAAVSVKGTSEGTITDINGEFTLNAEKGVLLLIRFVGFETQEVIASANMSISLNEDATQLEDVIVTGVFDPRTSMESSIAISTIDSEDMDRLAPNSSSEIFLNTPGVFVNSSSGETRNQVYTRGISAGSSYVLSQDINGYFYISLQEDGLPVTAISDARIITDLFFRADATVQRLESVRGGSSAITSVNAPGGIFNFISKNGTQSDKLVRTKVGLEGDGSNPYFRADFNFGDRINEELFYNIGGFYRQSEGARYVGYPLNNGGQIKANVTKLYSKGLFRVNLKYLSDVNGFTSVLPAVGFDDVALAPGAKITDTYLFPEGTVNMPNGDTTGGFNLFDPTIPQKSEDVAAGLNWEHELTDSWTIKNNFKYSSKSMETNSNLGTSFASLEDPTLFFLLGILGNTGDFVNAPGTLTLTDRGTGEQLASVDLSFPGGVPTLGANLGPNFPQISGNDVIYSAGQLDRGSLNEVMNQITISKNWENAAVHFGSFYSRSEGDIFEQNVAGSTLSVIGNRPQPLDVVFTLIPPLGSQEFLISDPETGYFSLGGAYGYNQMNYTVDQLAFFLGNNFSLMDNKLNVDWGLRYETVKVEGTNDRAIPGSFVGINGGPDRDTTTVYDDFSTVRGFNFVDYSTELDGLSVSAGVNYRINENNAVYVRYARGLKAPDMRLYNTYITPTTPDDIPPRNQTITQYEVAYRIRKEKFRGTFTPFFSQLEDVATITLTGDDNNQVYFPETQFNSQQAYGIEIEFDWTATDKISLAGSATIQGSEYTDWNVWIINGLPRDDDVLVDFSGNEAENTPNVLLNLTPSYNADKYFVQFQFRYMGSRQANQPNAYEIPGFSQLNFGAAYDISKNFTVGLNINNLTNTFGVMSSFAPGDYTKSIIPNSLTREDVLANLDAVRPVVAIQPRAYFLTFSYRF